MNENQIALIEEAITVIRRNIIAECERHYDGFIFEPRFQGEDTLTRYMNTYASYEVGLINALEDMIYAEDELPDPDYSDGPN